MGSPTPSGLMAKTASASAMFGEPTTFATRVSPRPLRSVSLKLVYSIETLVELRRCLLIIFTVIPSSAAPVSYNYGIVW